MHLASLLYLWLELQIEMVGDGNEYVFAKNVLLFIKAILKALYKIET